MFSPRKKESLPDRKQPLGASTIDGLGAGAGAASSGEDSPPNDGFPPTVRRATGRAQTQPHQQQPHPRGATTMPHLNPVVNPAARAGTATPMGEETAQNLGFKGFYSQRDARVAATDASNNRIVTIQPPKRMKFNFALINGN